MSFTERSYGGVSRVVLSAVNPFKKMILQTECQVHQMINLQAVRILKNDGHEAASRFYSTRLGVLNAGVIWADQDFKSINHFYHPYRRRGAFGHSNSLRLVQEYYRKACSYYTMGKIHQGLFYLGAAVHLIQDATIPQHASIRFLDQHRKFENFVKELYLNSRILKANRRAIEFDEIKEYVQFNSRTALKMYRRFQYIESRRRRFFHIARCSLPLAERSTAGCLMMFYRNHEKEAPNH